MRGPVVNFGDERVPSRIWDKISPEPNSGCWLWTAYVMPNGYGQCGRGGKFGGMALTHRFVFEHLHGSIPDGLQLDHLCRNTVCCNPAHLEAVTPTENVRRSDRATARRKCVAKKLAKTECQRGHAYVAGNFTMEDGKRRCMLCKRVTRRASYHRRKGAA